MASVVFLRAVNVGRINRCQPAVIARDLAEFGVVNIGAVGTFVVREPISDSALRTAIATRLPFKCEIMICSAQEVIELAAKDPFAEQPSGPNITRFVSVLATPPPNSLPVPFHLPSEDKWLLKIIARRGRFLLGVYHREMKAISGLGKIEKQLGVPVTTRNWNTFERVLKVLNHRQVKQKSLI